MIVAGVDRMTMGAQNWESHTLDAQERSADMIFFCSEPPSGPASDPAVAKTPLCVPGPVQTDRTNFIRPSGGIWNGSGVKVL